jgi:uncharacterized protein (TIRG00374 family)
MLWMRAMRWHLVLPQSLRLSTPRLVDATILGLFANTVLPLRAGEIIRPWILSRWQPVSFSAAFASVMMERLADSVCLLSLLVLCLVQWSEVPPLVLIAARALAVLTAALIAIVVLSYRLPGKMESLFHRIGDALTARRAPQFGARLNHMITEYFAGLRVITSFRQLAKFTLWTYAIWIWIAAWYQGLMWAFGEYPSLWVGLVLNVTIALAVAAPSAPGFIGTFQLGCILALSTVFGYSTEFAVAYSVVGHVLQTVLAVAAGLLVLHGRGLRLRQLRQHES